MNSPMLERFQHALATRPSLRWEGVVVQVTGNLIESQGPVSCIGEECEVRTRSGQVVRGEVIGFRGNTVLSMLTGTSHGVQHGDKLVALGSSPMLRVGTDLLGRVLDAEGHPLDGADPFLTESALFPVGGQAPKPLSRVPIREPLGCGVRSVDAFVSCGRGQRLGIFWRKWCGQKHVTGDDGERNGGRHRRDGARWRARSGGW